MYVITGVTGHTGKVAAEALLARGAEVRVVVRDLSKGKAWAAKGAEVAVADLVDTAALTKAFGGAEGVYVLLPPNLGAADVFAWQAQAIASIASAIAAAAVPHVVALSSVGASQPSGTGPIVSVHRLEQALLGVATHATFLRAGWFHENLGSMLGTLPHGELHSFFPAALAVPGVATRDIGALAATLLVEGATTHGAVVELGSAFTFDEVAQAIGEVTGATPRVVVHPPSGQAAVLTGYGVPGPIAALYQEMTEAIISGHIAWEAGRRHVAGRTTLAVTLRTLLAQD